jgi:hypothetical protein
MSALFERFKCKNILLAYPFAVGRLRRLQMQHASLKAYATNPVLPTVTLESLAEAHGRCSRD